MINRHIKFVFFDFLLCLEPFPYTWLYLIIKPDNLCSTSCAAALEVKQGGNKAVADNKNNI